MGRVQHYLADRLGIGLLVGLEHRPFVLPASRCRDVFHGITLPFRCPLPTQCMPHPAWLRSDFRKLIRLSQPGAKQVGPARIAWVLRGREDGRVTDTLLCPPGGDERVFHALVDRYDLLVPLLVMLCAPVDR